MEKNSNSILEVEQLSFFDEKENLVVKRDSEVVIEEIKGNNSKLYYHEKEKCKLYYENGNLSFELKDYTKAKLYFDFAIDSANFVGEDNIEYVADIYDKRGEISELQNDYQAAYKDYDNCIRINDKESKYFIKRARIGKQIADNYKGYTEKIVYIEGAINDYKISKELNESLNFNYELAKMYLELFKYKGTEDDYELTEAIKYFSVVIDQNNEYTTECIKSRCYCYRLLQMNNEEERDLEKLIELDCINPTNHYNMSLFNYKSSNYTKSLNYIDNALQINPNDYKSHILKGRIYESMKMKTKAVKCYQDASLCDIENPRAFIHIANIYQSQNQHTLVIENITKAKELTNNNFYNDRIMTAYENRAEYHLAKENKEAAIADLKKAKSYAVYEKDKSYFDEKIIKTTLSKMGRQFTHFLGINKN